MNSARHDVVARSLRCRLRQHRSFDLEKAALIEESTRRLLKLVPEDEIILQIAAAQIEVSVLEPQLLGGKFLPPPPRNWNRRRLSRPYDLEITGLHFDLAGFHLRVPHLRGTRRDIAFDG